MCNNPLLPESHSHLCLPVPLPAKSRNLSLKPVFTIAAPTHLDPKSRQRNLLNMTPILPSKLRLDRSVRFTSQLKSLMKNLIYMPGKRRCLVLTLPWLLLLEFLMDGCLLMVYPLSCLANHRCTPSCGKV